MLANFNQSRHRGHQPITLAALGWMFLRVACTSFGGFMTMVSVVQNMVVERRKLVSDRDVLDGLSLASVLPGPVAINVVAYIGYRLRGVAGAVVSVIAAVLPACVLMILLGTAYFRWGHVPAISKVFMGIVPAVTAIVSAAAWRMCRTAVVSMQEGLLALGAVLAMCAFTGIYVTPSVMLAAGVIGYWRFGTAARREGVASSASKPGTDDVPVPLPQVSVSRINTHLLALAMPASAAPLVSMQPLMLIKLFHAFVGISMAMFGGGYVFIPMLQHAVVDGYGWVTRQEFIDAVALGQLTPGPVAISATFIGLKVAGISGALVATVGMFAPPAALMVLCARLLAGINESLWVKAALRGVRAATAGMVCVAAIEIGKSAVPSWLSVVLFLSILTAHLRYRIEAVWLIPAAGLAGWLVY